MKMFTARFSVVNWPKWSFTNPPFIKWGILPFMNSWKKMSLGGLADSVKTKWKIIKLSLSFKSDYS